MRSFVKIRPSRNGEIIMLFTDLGKSYSSRDCLTSQIRLLTLFAKIHFRENFRIYNTCICDIFQVFWQLQARLSLLFVICKTAVIPNQTCPRLTRQESEAVWARYWAIEARLHWSFYLIPSIRSGSANTLPVIDAK